MLFANCVKIFTGRFTSYFFYPGGHVKLALGGLCLIIAAAMGHQVPNLLAQLGRNYGNEGEFYHILGNMAALFVGVYLNRALYQWLAMSYVVGLIVHVRSRCYRDWLLNHDIQTDTKSTADRYPMGEVIARIMSDTEAFRELITSGTLGIFIDLFFVISCLVSFIALHTSSGLALLGVELAAGIFFVWAGKYMRRAFMRVRNSRGNVFQTLANMIGGVRETHYMDHGGYAAKKGEGAFRDFLQKIMRANVLDASYYSAAEGLYPLLLVFIAFLLPRTGVVEVAIVFSMVDLVQRSIEPIKGTASKITNIQRAWTGFERVRSFLDDMDHLSLANLEFEDRPGTFETMAVRVGEFSYPHTDGRKAGAFFLKNIDFEVRRGQLVGIVGRSGCGKSTLLNIIAANIIPRKARIRLLGPAGTELEFPGNSQQDIGDYRTLVGMVSQESHIFSESVAFNISLRRKTPDGFGDFWDWVTDKVPYLGHWGVLPETALDQKALSTGQRQLLAAIRACYLKKAVVLFDEISSGLDSDLEEALRNMMALVRASSVTFVVAHRLETIMGADRILLMQNGEVISSGSHYQLYRRSSIYRNFVLELS